MNKPTHLLIHCSDSMWGDAATIDRWHKERGWSGIGYHLVVLNGCRTYSQRKDGRPSATDDGRIEQGRAEHEVGSHARGYNDRSIGICLIGAGGDFTERQIQALRELVERLRARYGIQRECVIGHCETDDGRRQGKTCPTLDMVQFRESLTP